MKNLNQKNNQKKFALIVVVLFSFIFLFQFSSYLIAETKGRKVSYVDIITEDEEENRLFFPVTVFAEPVMKEIYVIDGRSRVIIYTSDFFPLFTLDKRNGVETPSGLSVDKDGNLYIAQTKTKENPRHRISVFNACLKWKRDIYLEGFEGAELMAPNSIVLDDKGNIYITGTFYPSLVILNKEGHLIDIISPTKDGSKVQLTDVALDKKGRIYLVSEIEGRVYVYDKNRKFLFGFGQKGGSSGKLSRPVALAVDDARERIYVVDYMRHTISAYSTKDGKYLFEFGGLGWGEGWFQHPKDIAVDSTGRLLVADTFNDRIEVLKPED